jgi:hypothetical protein
MNDKMANFSFLVQQQVQANLSKMEDVIRDKARKDHQNKLQKTQKRLEKYFKKLKKEGLDIREDDINKFLKIFGFESHPISRLNFLNTGELNRLIEIEYHKIMELHPSLKASPWLNFDKTVSLITEKLVKYIPTHYEK